MRTPRGSWPLIVGVVMAALLFAVPAASAKPKAPGSLLPTNAKKLTALPVFTWAPIKSADHYEFQIASDRAFSVAVKADSGPYSTKNTAMVLPSAVPTGTYFWRIRAVTASGVSSSWTKARSFSYTFAPVTNVLGPDSGTAFTIPPASLSESLILRWAPMPGAAQYAVSVAKDALMASLVTSGNAPEVIDGTSYTLDGRLTDGTYYWSVTPIDAQGNKGIPSAIRTFSVAWQASAGVPTMTDIASGDQLLDPLFSWSPVFGASGYEVEVSTSQDFAASSKVCCGGTTTATSFSPTALFQDNQYFWRVRPYDSAGNPGPWTGGAPFTTTFDNVPPLPGPSITGIRMRDMSDIGTTASQDPVIEWDPVMGASSYQLEIDNYVGGVCNESLASGKYSTVSTAWAPMGDSTGSPTFGNSGGPRGEQAALTDGASYCVKLRAVNSDPSGNVVYGDWTFVNNFQSPMFTFSATPPATTVAPCNSGLWECPANYVEPAANAVETSTPPVFVWKPVTGAHGYYIVISKDPNFANILDYAYTNQPTYTPRDKTYADETSPIYWAVLPTSQVNGTGYPTSGNLPTLGGKQVFTKQSVPPTVTSLNATGAGVSFQWAPQLGAAYYQLQVSTDSTFSSTLEDVQTDSASYTAAKSYPAGQTLYYRLRTLDAGGNALTWSPVATFTRTLPAPVPVAPTGDFNPSSLDGVPTWSWSAVSGAVSYDVHVDYPDGTSKDVNGIQPITFSWDKFDGAGSWHWKVRAEFPTGGSTVPGPYSAVQTFTRLFGAPTGRHSVVTKSRVLFSWLTKQGAKQYHFQIGTNKDFSSTVEDVTQDATGFAPTLTESGFVNGGPLLWRVAAVDAEGNQSPWSPIMRVALAKGLKITGDTTPSKDKAGVVTITVVDAKGKPVKGVTVRVAGAGTAPRAKKTNRKGIVALGVRPTSAGAVIFRATKSGYQLATLTDQVS